MASNTDTTPLQVQLPKDLHAKLRAEAEKRLVHPSLLVSRAVEKFLHDLVPLEEHLRTVHDAAAQAGYETKPAEIKPAKP